MGGELLTNHFQFMKLKVENPAILMINGNIDIEHMKQQIKVITNAYNAILV